MIKKRCIDLKGGTNRVDKLKSGPGIPDTGLQSETFSVSLKIIRRLVDKPLIKQQFLELTHLENFELT